MNYLVVCKTESNYYLLTSNDNSIQGYESKEALMKAFSGYTKAWTNSYESSMSSCIGMMQMCPVAIKAPDDINDLKKYLSIDQKIYHISGGAIGRGYNGVIVSADILELQQFDIWHESMVQGGMYGRPQLKTEYIPI